MNRIWIWSGLQTSNLSCGFCCKLSSAVMVGSVVVCISKLLASAIVSSSVVVCVCRSSSTAVVPSVVDSSYGIESLENLVSEIFLELFLTTNFLLPPLFLVAIACTCCCALTLSVGCLGNINNTF